MSLPKSIFTSAARLLVIAGLLTTAYFVGQSVQEAAVQAEVRPGQNQQEHFRSGAQRSEDLLRGISATLNKMDARLERMEKLAAQLNMRAGQSASGETRSQ